MINNSMINKVVSWSQFLEMEIWKLSKKSLKCWEVYKQWMDFFSVGHILLRNAVHTGLLSFGFALFLVEDYWDHLCFI